MSDVPRRIQMQQWCEAERKIYDAVQAVEAMAADVRLTDAVVLLGAARDRVADFVDGVEGTRTVPSDVRGGAVPLPPELDATALAAAERAYWHDDGVSRHNLGVAILAYLGAVRAGPLPPSQSVENLVDAVRAAFTKRWPYEVTPHLWDTLRASVLAAVRGLPPVSPEPTVPWEHADLAAETAEGLRKHFQRIGGIPDTLRLTPAHWQLIVLALERAASSEPSPAAIESARKTFAAAFADTPDLWVQIKTAMQFGERYERDVFEYVLRAAYAVDRAAVPASTEERASDG